jgi:hypothetical protein
LIQYMFWSVNLTILNAKIINQRVSKIA